MSVFRRRRSTLNPHPLIAPQPLISARCETLEARRLMADIWSGAGADTNFSDADNWIGDVAPVSGQAVTFPAGASSAIVTIDKNVTVGDIEFDASYTVNSSGSSSTATIIALRGSINETAGDTVINAPIALDQTTNITLASPATLTLNGVVSNNNGGNAFGITEMGTGTLTLASPTGDTYTGPTTVNGGTLVDSANTTLDSDVSVAAGASFVGDSSIDSLSGTGGTYSAANGTGSTAEPGTATLAEGLNLAGTNNTMDFIVGGPDNSSQFVVNGGEVDLDNAVLNATALTFASSGGDVITLIANNTGLPIIGTFNGLAEGATTVIGGEDYTISYIGGASGNDVTLTAVFSATTTTTVTLSKTPIYENETEVLTARVIGSDGTIPTGSVEFYENTARIGRATLDGGVATIGTDTLPAGADQIYAVYDGGGIHAGSTSSTVTVSVHANTIPIIEGAVTAALATDSVTLTDPFIAAGFNFGDTFVVDDALANDAADPATTHGVSVGLAVFATDTNYANYIPPNNSYYDPDLTYTWTTLHAPSGAKQPTFNENGTNAASGIGGIDGGIYVPTADTTSTSDEPLIVHFYKDGGYILQCQVTNPSEQSTYVDVYATVSQKASSFRIEPHKAQILQDATQQYTATVLDQFGHPMRAAQTLTYAVQSGEQSGSISSTGLFFATSVDGAVIIEVEDGLLTGTVSADVV
jgi:autotransporter-associated beta strand protein